MMDKYLPIGTIVLLKDGDKKLMITGYGFRDNNTGMFYDYSGCLYPEGIISLSNTFAFNHDQISYMFFMGYMNEEQKDFQVKLKDVIYSIDGLGAVESKEMEVLNLDDYLES